MRVAILRTDSVRDDLQVAHGDYPGMFESLLAAASGAEFRYEAFDVRATLPLEINCDVYLITGSRHSVYADLPWIRPLAEFMGAVVAAGKKVLGVCFGHQLMAHFFGGRVAPAAVGWGVGVLTSEVCNRASWMQPRVDELSLIASHQDQVLELPTGAQVYIGSDFCPYGGYTVGDQIMTVQNHPEFSKAYIAELMDTRKELLGEQVLAQGHASLVKPTDEATLAQWLVNFVNEEQG